MNVRLALVVILVGLGLSPSIHAETAPRVDFPCKGCLYWPPPSEAKNAALLVVLHGDAPGGKTPLVKRDSEPFVKAATARGIAVLAPYCPKDEGCLVGSYWQWSQGDPAAWIAKQVAAVRRESVLDPNRTWLVGWSGGASFLGYHYSRWSDSFAALAFVGGGIPPYASTCASCSSPAYFLVGNKNPLHHLAKDLKEKVSACTKEVVWDLLPGMDHGGEWRAITQPAKADAVLDWLEKHPRDCGKTSPPEPPAVASAMPGVSSVPTNPGSETVAPSASASPEVAPIAVKAEPKPHAISSGRGCSMAMSHSQTAPELLAWIVGLGAVSARRCWPRKMSRKA